MLGKNFHDITHKKALLAGLIPHHLKPMSEKTKRDLARIASRNLCPDALARQAANPQ